MVAASDTRDVALREAEQGVEVDVDAGALVLEGLLSRQPERRHEIVAYVATEREAGVEARLDVGLGAGAEQRAGVVVELVAVEDHRKLEDVGAELRA